MNILEAGLLGILQGITEFLPVSSSGHLVLGQSVLGLNPEALKSFDIAIHGGTLIAIFLYFWRDIWNLLISFVQTIFRIKLDSEQEIAQLKENQKMIVMLVLGTIPAVIVGALWGDFLDEYFLNPLSVSVLLIVVGAIFLLVEWIHKKVQSSEITLGRGIMIGVAQAAALIPGVSRSGATISAGLVMGVDREKAARFSFLLGSIAMLAATILALYKGYKGEYTVPAMDTLITGIVTSFISGIAAIHFLMTYLKKHTLALFAYYRFVVAGAFLIYYFAF